MGGVAALKKMKTRSMSVLLIVLAVLFGMGVYIMRYIDRGGSWAWKAMQPGDWAAAT